MTEQDARITYVECCHSNFFIREWVGCMKLSLLLDSWMQKEDPTKYHGWTWQYLADKFIEKYFKNKKIDEVEIKAPYRIGAEWTSAPKSQQKEFKKFLETIAEGKDKLFK